MGSSPHWCAAGRWAARARSSCGRCSDTFATAPRRQAAPRYRPACEGDVSGRPWLGTPPFGAVRKVPDTVESRVRTTSSHLRAVLASLAVLVALACAAAPAPAALL